MRLIDADALKEEVNKKKVVGRFNTLLLIDNAPTIEAYTKDDMTSEYLKGYNACKDMNESPQSEPVIKCKDCKYQVKEWRKDKRTKENGYWVYGCKHFGDTVGYWAFGGNDYEFCSDAKQKGDVE